MNELRPSPMLAWVIILVIAALWFQNEELTRLVYLIVGGIVLYQGIRWARAGMASAMNKLQVAACQDQAEMNRRRDNERAAEIAREYEEIERRREELLAEATKREAAGQDPDPKKKLLEAVEKRFEERLRVIENSKLDEIEKMAAREKAKQKYMKDLDEVMK